jgi:hypothetical protein
MTSFPTSPAARTATQRTGVAAFAMSICSADFSDSQFDVTATVTKLLPKMGIAYLDGDAMDSWVITRSTLGSGLESLHEGQRVRLALTRHVCTTFVKAYAPLS